jgi:type IV secretory pathway TraG/TraD family ATPase VirD4
MGHLNASVDNIERPLLTPDEVQRLKAPKKKGHGIHERIVAPGQMLIFVSGYFPILGTQMLYFLDPTFKMRSEIPPPTKLVRLTGNQLKKQAGLRRPDRSHAEQAFLEGLNEQDQMEESPMFDEMEESHAAEESY